MAFHRALEEPFPCHNYHIFNKICRQDAPFLQLQHIAPSRVGYISLANPSTRVIYVASKANLVERGRPKIPASTIPERRNDYGLLDLSN